MKNAINSYENHVDRQRYEGIKKLTTSRWSDVKYIPSPVDIVPNPNRTKISNIELIPLENKLEHFILRFHREKMNFFEGADFDSKRPPSFITE